MCPPRTGQAATGIAGSWKPEERLTVGELIHIERRIGDRDAGHHIGFPAETRNREETNPGPEHGFVVTERPPCDAHAWVEIMVVRLRGATVGKPAWLAVCTGEQGKAGFGSGLMEHALMVYKTAGREEAL